MVRKFDQLLKTIFFSGPMHLLVALMSVAMFTACTNTMPISKLYSNEVDGTLGSKENLESLKESIRLASSEVMPSKENQIKAECLFALQNDLSKAVPVEQCVYELNEDEQKTKRAHLATFEHRYTIRHLTENKATFYRLERIEKDLIGFAADERSADSVDILSSIFIIKKDTTTEHLQSWATVTLGDRCDGGWAAILHLSSKGVYYSTSATPFRLLNPSDVTKWRYLYGIISSVGASDLDIEKVLEDEGVSKLFHGLRPFDDLENSPEDCFGNIIRFSPFNGRAPTTVAVVVDYKKFAQTRSQHTDAHRCFADFLNEENIRKWVTPSKFGKDLFTDDAVIPTQYWSKLMLRFKNKCAAGPGL